MLYCTLVRYKLQYASVAWNSITVTDASKSVRIQPMFVSVIVVFAAILNTTMLMS